MSLLFKRSISLICNKASKSVTSTVPILFAKDAPKRTFAVRIGGKAPSFTTTAVVNGRFETIDTDKYKGKWVVLCINPKEIMEFSDRYKEFQDRTCHVLGGSHSYSSGKELKFALITELSTDVSSSYSCLHPDGSTATATYIIDDKGIVRYISLSDCVVGHSVDEILRILDAVQYSQQYIGVDADIDNDKKYNMMSFEEEINLDSDINVNVIKECCVEEMVEILKNGVFQIFIDENSTKNKDSALEAIDNWQNKIIQYFVDNRLDGKAFINMSVMDVCESMMDHLETSNKQLLSELVDVIRIIYSILSSFDTDICLIVKGYMPTEQNYVVWFGDGVTVKSTAPDNVSLSIPSGEVISSDKKLL